MAEPSWLEDGVMIHTAVFTLCDTYSLDLSAGVPRRCWTALLGGIDD